MNKHEKKRSTKRTHNTVKVERDTLLLQRVRELEAALEARGQRGEAAGIQGAYTALLVAL